MKPLHFAPLQGYTDDVYRRLHHRLVGGIAAYYTPFVRWEHGGVRSKDLRDIAPEHNEGVPLVPQVIAADADELARLVDVIAPLGYRRIDLNMGCPFPLQARHGRGSGLMAQCARAAEIFERMRTYPELAFSVKLRLGWDDAAQLDRLAPLVAAAPLVSVTLHPRLGTAGYKGTADRAAFARFAAVCPHPLLYNGDLLTPTDVEAFVAAQPTVAGVMIGRGLLARVVGRRTNRPAAPPARRPARGLCAHRAGRRGAAPQTPPLLGLCGGDHRAQGVQESAKGGQPAQLSARGGRNRVRPRSARPDSGRYRRNPARRTHRTDARPTALPNSNNNSSTLRT